MNISLEENSNKKTESVSTIVKTCRNGQFGNKSNYYSQKKTNPWNDKRLEIINAKYFNNCRVLDIGCHEGYLPIHIFLKYQTSKIDAIDVDTTTLIRAVKRVQIIDKIIKNQNLSDSEINLKLFEEDKILGAVKIYKKYCNKKPILSGITFMCKNIIDLDPYMKTMKYDTILALKLTKYIHLNFGDEGIITMFKNIFCLLNVGGHLILQSQSFKKYKKMKNFVGVFKKNINQIKLFPEKFIEFLTLNFSLELISSNSFNDDFNNYNIESPILIFQKTGNLTSLL